MTVIHQTGGDYTDWKLVVEDGVVEARKGIPFDGVLRFTTESGANSPRKNSEFGLLRARVVERYVSNANPQADEATLRKAAREAVGEVKA